MENIVERFYKDVMFFSGSAEDAKRLVRAIGNTSADERGQSMIKFFGRRHHNRILAEKAEIDNGFKRFIGEVDDVVARIAKYWKDLDAKYRYFYKDIVRR